MLRISKQTDYGVYIMSRLVGEGSLPQYSAKEIAEQTGIAPAMVRKILKLLARGGLVVSHRGATGGYELARPAAEINLAQIIATLEGTIAMTECGDKEKESDCKIECSCDQQNSWQRITELIQELLTSISIEDWTQDDACPATARWDQVVAGFGTSKGI